MPFAGLLELLRPALGYPRPDPGAAGGGARGRARARPASAQDRFAVGAATLSLLAAYAEDGPVAVLIDDAHWLDASSAEAVLFAIRRLVADPIAVVLTVRDGEPSLLDGADLPLLRIGGIDRDAAAALGRSRVPAVDRLYRATAGNPLALLELAPRRAARRSSARGARADLDEHRARLPAPLGLACRAQPAHARSRRCERQRRPGGARARGLRAGSRMAALAAARRGSCASARATSSSVIRSPAPRSTATPRPRNGGLLTARSPARCPTGISTAAPGTSPPQLSGQTRQRRPRSSRPARARSPGAHTPKPLPPSNAPRGWPPGPSGEASCLRRRRTRPGWQATPTARSGCWKRSRRLRPRRSSPRASSTCAARSRRAAARCRRRSRFSPAPPSVRPSSIPKPPS